MSNGFAGERRIALSLGLALSFFSPALAGDQSQLTATQETNNQAGQSGGTTGDGTQKQGAEAGSTTGGVIQKQAAGSEAGNSASRANTDSPAQLPEKEKSSGACTDSSGSAADAGQRDENPSGLHRSGSEKAVEKRAPLAEPAAKISSPAAAVHPAAEKPVKLYGRIEELCSGTGARLPLKMKALVPIRDSSLDDKNKIAGKVALQAYPIDYRGSWSGELTVNSTNFDKTYFQYAPEEARKEAQLLRPGTKGQYSVTFYEGSNHRIEMQPSQVMFQGSESMGSQMKLMSKSNPGLSAMFGAQSNSMMSNMQVPVMFALHMGTPITSGEMGVTGNQLSTELMKNTLRELSRGVLENQVVTRDRDRDPTTGKVQDGFSESVLRFTRLNRDQLYLQAAYVYYRSNGQFQAKYVLYGTLNRGNGSAATYPGSYGSTANPFGGLMPGMGGGANPLGGMGGAGNLQQQMQQMQKMIQQMGGK